MGTRERDPSQRSRQSMVRNMGSGITGTEMIQNFIDRNEGWILTAREHNTTRP